MSKQKRQLKYFGDASCDDAYSDMCPHGRLLPDGIERLTEEAICATRLMPVSALHDECVDDEPCPNEAIKDDKQDKCVGAGIARTNSSRSDSEFGKAHVAAFDFDGTCISGSSPKKLVDSLIKKNLLSPYKIFRVGLWGLAYKLNLPKDPNGVRQRVFSAFAGFSAEKVNDFLCRFYHEKIACLFRSDADAAMIAHIEAGHEVVLISASFEPIIASAMVEHPIPIAMATRMTIDENGCYTGNIDGLPTEGPGKIEVLIKFLDEYYGKDGWELGWAYGDHYSDVPLLEAAANPCAVTPDAKLRRYAEDHGWSVLDWS